MRIEIKQPRVPAQFLSELGVKTVNWMENHHNYLPQKSLSGAEIKEENFYGVKGRLSAQPVSLGQFDYFITAPINDGSKHIQAESFGLLKLDLWWHRQFLLGSDHID